MIVGARNSGYQAFSVASRFLRTRLLCSPAVASKIRQWTAPFFEVDVAPDGAADGWTVAAPDARREAGDCEIVSVKPLGEVETRLAVDRGRKTIHLIAPVTEDWVAQNLLRYTRSLHRLAARARGVAYVHAGLVRVDGVGIAVVGASRAGKTSLLMALARNKHGRLVSNDDLGVAFEGDAVVGFGWPRSISVRLDTLDAVYGSGRRAGYLAGLTHPANRTLSELVTQGIEKHGTALFYPFEYAARFDIDLAVQGGIDVVLFSGFADGAEGRTLARMSRAEASAAVDAYAVRDANKHAAFLDTDAFPPRSGTLDLIKHRLSALPCFRLRYVFRDVNDEAGILLDTLARTLGRRELASAAAQMS